MKANVKVNNELSFQVEAETEEEVFKQVARVQEIFQHQACGNADHQTLSLYAVTTVLKMTG